MRCQQSGVIYDGDGVKQIWKKASSVVAALWCRAVWHGVVLNSRRPTHSVGCRRPTTSNWSLLLLTTLFLSLTPSITNRSFSIGHSLLKSWSFQLHLLLLRWHAVVFVGSSKLIWTWRWVESKLCLLWCFSAVELCREIVPISILKWTIRVNPKWRRKRASLIKLKRFSRINYRTLSAED